MKFKVGDYIKIKEGLNHKDTDNFIKEMEEYCGKIARIIKINDNSYSLDIDNEAWFWDEHMVESIRSKKYEVTVEGNTVTVTDDKGNIGIAKCSPEDEFDLSTGISLAIERLRWKPNQHEHYWTIDFSQLNHISDYVWLDDSTDKRLFKNGIVFKTKEEAIKVAKKMLGVV